MKKLSLLAMFAVGSVCSSAMAQVGPDPSEIYIRDIYYSGTGCPGGSVSGLVSSDGTVFTATFEQFYAMQGPSWDRTQRRKSCNLTVDLHAPQGYSYSIFRLNTLGYVDLDDGTSAEQKVMMRFAGDAITKSVSFQTPFYGPADEDFFVTNEVGIQSLVWSRCGGGIPLNITTTITATAASPAEAIIGIDQQDGRLQHEYGIMWRLCEDTAPPVIPEISPANVWFSYAGPMSGKSCVRINEPADPHTWNDNYLCSDANLGLKWSYSGPLSGMTCVQINEPADPHAWQDNYLCSAGNLGLRWSYAGQIPGMRCILVNEPSDPYGWTDNYLCMP